MLHKVPGDRQVLGPFKKELPIYRSCRDTGERTASGGTLSS